MLHISFLSPHFPVFHLFLLSSLSFSPFTTWLSRIQTSHFPLLNAASKIPHRARDQIQALHDLALLPAFACSSHLNPELSLCSRITSDQSFLSLEHSPIFINAQSSSLRSLIHAFSLMAACKTKLGQVPPSAPLLSNPYDA